MKRLITVIILLLFTLVLGACSSKDASFEDRCWKQVEDYEATELEDGTISVSLFAPDYTALLNHLVEAGIEDELTVDILIEAAEDYPDAVKEYRFSASSAEEETVRKELMEQIAYEMMILVMDNYKG